ncbi:Peptide deformylase [Pseudocohnilembus persalinus]|uniref:Peptide deformylase n=1 Tax=Pseudocohnilembus persalinus TaxID=266149 RepID=A0A0V0QP44_PSEPJ|nr:Peptide deformylase [Pseudocohnilembus persalinus]|eukprot:KRX04050.1 Peptide deformylase [Pseudocohnilembus persalinus]
MNSAKLKAQILQILPCGHEKLGLCAMETGYLTKNVKIHIESLKLTACAYNQVSLSNIQVGQNFNLFVILKNLSDFQQLTSKKNKFNNITNWKNNLALPHNFNVYVNPQIVQVSNVEDMQWEQSVIYPFLEAQIRRFEKIIIEHMDDKGQRIKQQFEGFDARVVQQNITSLRGIQFIDFKQTQGRIRLNPEYQDLKETKYLVDILEKYREFGENYSQQNPSFFEYDISDYKIVEERMNPRVTLDKKNMPELQKIIDDKQAELNQNEANYDIDQQQKELHDKIQQFYEDINYEGL